MRYIYATIAITLAVAIIAALEIHAYFVGHSTPVLIAAFICCASTGYNLALTIGTIQDERLARKRWAHMQHIFNLYARQELEAITRDDE